VWTGELYGLILFLGTLNIYSRYVGEERFLPRSHYLNLYHKRLPLILAIVQLLNVLLGGGVCLHSLKALSDVIERLAFSIPTMAAIAEMCATPYSNATELS